MTPPTYTERLRERVKAATGVCPTCGQPTNAGGVRVIADAIGVTHTVLWRFLRGKGLTSQNIDLIEAWLARATFTEPGE